MYRGVREMLLLLDGAVSDAVMGQRCHGHGGLCREQVICIADATVFDVTVQFG